jgi:hypothetical protein
MKVSLAIIGLAFCAGGVLVCAEPLPEAVRWALAQIETGASEDGFSTADRMRGKKQEVSRYQILPKVWAHYAATLDFTNPVHAWTAVQRILEDRRQWFRRLTGRDASPFDLYALWNAPGHYAQVGFNRARLRPAVAERAERFAALVELCWGSRTQGPSWSSLPLTGLQHDRNARADSLRRRP